MKNTNNKQNDTLSVIKEERELQYLSKSIKLFTNIFLSIIIADILICIYFKQDLQLISSVMLLGGLIVTKALIHYKRYKAGTIFLCYVFFGIGVFNAVVIGNYITCCLILVVAPIITSLLLDNLITKLIIIGSAIILFILCNILIGVSPFENYYYFFGLIPSSFLMIHFYNKLRKITNEKNILIKSLKEKNEEVLLFSNMMSHDLKAPLRSIEGFSKLLRRKATNLNEEENKYLEFIIQGSNDMQNLINDLLKYSQFSINELSQNSLDFKFLISQIVYSFDYDIKKQNVQIKTKNLSSLIGHEESIYLLFQNLISNAIKYQPKDPNHQPVIEICQRRENNKNIITVRDNGIGMNIEDIDEILAPFKRLNNSSDYEGTGLGMSIVNKIIEKHQGEISVMSSFGLGSSFQVVLPDGAELN